MSLMETFEQSKRRAPHAERAKKGATRKHSLYRCDLSTNIYLELICKFGQGDDLLHKSLITQTSTK